MFERALKSRTFSSVDVVTGKPTCFFNNSHEGSVDRSAEECCSIAPVLRLLSLVGILKDAMSVERRKLQRYRTKAPVIFNWTDAEGRNHQGGGFARDVSTGGLFVFCNVCPAMNAAVTLQVLLPSAEGSKAAGLPLNGKGLVVRVERGEEAVGFAATTDFGEEPAPAC
jgi:hypothetical protein